MHSIKNATFLFFLGQRFYNSVVLSIEKEMKKDLAHIFHLAKKQDSLAQKTIYEWFSPKMLAIAKSYVNSKEDAEDVLLQSFCKAFQKINDCKDANSFQFWLRKIVVNDAINFIRKNKNILYAETDNLENVGDEILEENEENFPDFDLEMILSQMPIGYKLVFNLSVFEDKKHSEIAELLNINEGTSRSQLNKAKKWLVEFFKQQKNEQLTKK